MTITLTPNPAPGEIVTVDLTPDELSIRLIWQGNGVDNTKDYWKVVGTFSYGKVYDDIFVNKDGDVMVGGQNPLPTVPGLTRTSTNDGFLVNLDKTPGSEPYPPLVNGEYVSLFATLEQNGLNLGAFGIENNYFLTEKDGLPLKFRDDNYPVISGSPKVNNYLKVDFLPPVEGGDVTKVPVYTYEWEYIDDNNSIKLDPTRVIDGVIAVEPLDRGIGYKVEDLTTTSADPLTSNGCIVHIDKVNELGQVISLSVVNSGSGYAPGDVLDVTGTQGTDCKVIVTETLDNLQLYEKNPTKDDVRWLLNTPFEEFTERKMQIQDFMVGYHLRCKVTATRGDTVVSYSNSIGPITK